MSTEIIGNKEARVTTPNPDDPEPDEPTTRQMPMPRARTRGTVTGPVVTAPQSHASPVIFLMFSLKNDHNVKTIKKRN